MPVTGFSFVPVNTLFMLNLSEIKAGKLILVDGEPHKVLTNEHSKTGRMGAVMRTKLKNLVTGAVFDKTFQGSDKVDEATVDTAKAQYLYREDNEFAFMDVNTYEQFSLDTEVIGDARLYLTEGLEVSIMTFDERPIDLRLPTKVTLEVTEAPPSIKGNTSSGGDKVVTLATGAKVTTPLFIEVDDKVIVNTERGEYVSKES